MKPDELIKAISEVEDPKILNDICDAAENNPNYIPADDMEEEQTEPSDDPAEEVKEMSPMKKAKTSMPSVVKYESENMDEN